MKPEIFLIAIFSDMIFDDNEIVLITQGILKFIYFYPWLFHCASYILQNIKT